MSLDHQCTSGAFLVVVLYFKASIKICDVNYGSIGQKATSLVLPCLLKFGLQSSVSEVRAIG